MNSLKNGEVPGILILNFEGGTEFPILNFKGGPGVPLLNFQGVSGLTILSSRVPLSLSHFYTMPLEIPQI